MKPVLYLDVDGVLWDLPRDQQGHICSDQPCGARGIQEFIEFVLENFEARWCTAWALRGRMYADGLERLAEYTGISSHLWAQVFPSRGWLHHKHECIDAEEHREGRLFVWVEDDLTQPEHQWLRGNDWQDRYFYTDVFEDPDALLKTLEKLKLWIQENT